MMTFDWIEFKETQNIIPIKLLHKEQYYMDLFNIEQSLVSRFDVLFLANTFMNESTQLIINAIKLFELGYFDCAFYSLRQSLEVSTTLVFLVDKDEVRKEKLLKDWKNQNRFPMYKEMSDFLEKKGNVFTEMKERMSSYFEKIKKTKQKLNKYVHKQGFDKFYVSRNHPIFQKQSSSKESLRSEFEKYVEISIGAVAVYRLALDPFPILLNDERMYFKTGDLLTEAYSDEFIDKYIGKNHIKDYKNTAYYQEHYDFFDKHETKLPCVALVVKDRIINREDIDLVLSQKHLLSDIDLSAVYVSNVSKTISRISIYNGMLMYFTDTDSVRRMSWSTQDFENIKNAGINFDNVYENAFLSFIDIDNETYFIEHNEKFTDSEKDELINLTK